MMSLVLTTGCRKRTPLTHSPSPTQPLLSSLVYIPKRNLRQLYSAKKPKYRYKTDISGNLILPETLPGYTFDETEEFQKWLVKRTEKLKKTIGTKLGEKYRTDINSQIIIYFNSVWGEKKNLITFLANMKRAKNRKMRRERLLWKYIDDWNALQDAKENKIIRDKIRDEREDSHEPFSLKKFLSAHRDSKRKPYVIEDEETFRKRLEKDKENYLFRIPKSIRTVHRHKIGYKKRLMREIIDPFILEIRRRARVASLVREREDAIALVKYRQQMEEKKRKNLEARQEDEVKRRKHWNEVFGEWHKHNNTLKTMIREFHREREEIFTKSRLEYLKALQDNVELWRDSPSDCRFLRFRFAPGRVFPYNNTLYSK